MSVNSLLSLHEHPLLTCRPDEFLDEVVDRMVVCNRNAILVQEGGNRTLGILTDHDVMGALRETQQQARHIENEKVGDWMTHKVICVEVETKLTHALRLMGQKKIRHLVIVDKGLPVAIVNVRDILAQIHENDLLEISVLRDMALFSRGNPIAA